MAEPGGRRPTRQDDESGLMFWFWLPVAGAGIGLVFVFLHWLSGS